MGRVAAAQHHDSAHVRFAGGSVRELNQFLHGDLTGVDAVRVENPDGAHSIAVGVDAPVRIEVAGHAGYYAAA
jgi:hypothetical protein